MQDNPHIICGSVPGQRLTNLRSAWIRVRNSAALKNLRIHDLRRTVGSWLARDGASLHLVGAVLNHKDQKTTAGYAYFQTDDRQKALDKHGRKVINSIKLGAKCHTKHPTDPLAESPSRKLVMLTRMVGAGYKNRHATWCFGCRSRQGVSSIRHSNSPPGILGQDQGGILGS